MSDELAPEPSSELSADEKAAIRAYLQRSEVRLSTVHRVASALLSGAGLMVLLPGMAKDSIITVLTSLTDGDIGALRVLLMVAAIATLALPLAAFWLFLRDMTRFYFHAQHLRSAGDNLFIPRFALTGLRLPADELQPHNRSTLDAARRQIGNVELLVPASPAGKEKLDRRLAAYGLDTQADELSRAEGMFSLVNAHPRPLVEEVAKIEHGMARHVLGIQVIVLRYVKALVAFTASTLAVFAMSAVEGRNEVVGEVDEVWLAAIMGVWAAGVAIATAAPVRWLEKVLRAEGATRSGVANDPEMTRVERISTGFAAVVWGLCLIVVISHLTDMDQTTHGWGALVVVALAGVILAGHVAELIAHQRGRMSPWQALTAGRRG